MTSQERDRHVDLVEQACHQLRAAVGAERVSIWVLDDHGRAISPLVSVGPSAPASNVARRWSRYPLEHIGPFRDAVSTRAPVLLRDLAAADVPPGLGEDFAITSAWTTALEVGGEVLGVVVVEPGDAGERVDGSPWIDALARSLSAARGWYLADRRKAELDLLLDLTRAASATDDDGGAIAHLCQRLAASLGVRRACLFVIDDGALVSAEAHFADGRRDPELIRAFLTESVLPALLTEAARLWHTVVINQGARDSLGDWADRFEIGSGVAVPIGTRAEPLGVFTLDDAEERRFGPRLVSLAEAAATQFALLYERARLLDEQARTARAGEAVRRLLREGTRAVTAEAAVEVVARVGLEALEAEHATALLFDGDGTIEDVHTVGIPAPFDEEVRRRCLGLRVGDLALGRTVRERRRPVAVDDARNSGMLPAELFDGIPARSYVAIPLSAGETLRGGVIYSTSTRRRRWSEADRHLVEQLVLECDLIMENAVLREAEAGRSEQLAHLAMHDVLTGLPNRVLLEDRLDAALRAAARTGTRVGVLFVDLRRFKDVNDRFGHDAGDAALAQLAARFVDLVRPNDTVGRLAGDEFLVVLPDVCAEALAGVAERICVAADEPVEVGGHHLRVGASVGAAIGGPGTPPDELIRAADGAMYVVKRQTGTGWGVADELAGSAGSPGAG
ncbi:diguanylate cyclase domain-containing protein [Actinomarinicola tropica]|nr:diguanylate cyclase [Actinomarinicola tropica]